MRSSVQAWKGKRSDRGFLQEVNPFMIKAEKAGSETGLPFLFVSFDNHQIQGQLAIADKQVEPAARFFDPFKKFRLTNFHKIDIFQSGIREDLIPNHDSFLNCR
jgi:hypothetical protein